MSDSVTMTLSSVSMTNTRRLIATSTNTIPLPEPLFTGNYFSLTDLDLAVFALSGILILFTSVVSFAKVTRRNSKLEDLDLVRQHKETLQMQKMLKESKGRKHRFSVFVPAEGQTVESNVVYPVHWNPTDDAAFGDFGADATLRDEANVMSYLSPSRHRDDDMMRAAESELLGLHPTYDVPRERVGEVVARKVLHIDPRHIRLDRELRLQEDRVLQPLLSEAMQKEQGMSARRTVDVIPASSQVAPLALEHLPWLSHEQLEAIRAVESSTAVEALREGGRDLGKIVKERKSLSTFEDVGVMSDVGSVFDAPRGSALSVKSLANVRDAFHRNTDNVDPFDGASMVSSRKSDEQLSRSAVSGGARPAHHLVETQSPASRIKNITLRSNSGPLLGKGGSQSHVVAPAARMDFRRELPDEDELTFAEVGIEERIRNGIDIF